MSRVRKNPNGSHTVRTFLSGISHIYMPSLTFISSSFAAIDMFLQVVLVFPAKPKHRRLAGFGGFKLR